MSVPSVSLGIETVKKWVDYWRKFKGKRVRLWFARKDSSFVGHFFCAASTGPREERRFRNLILKLGSYGPTREIGICPCVEGTILDVVDSPFGFMLGDVHLWHALEWNQQNLIVGKTSTEIESQFIPMSEVARIDFVTEKGQ